MKHSKLILSVIALLFAVFVLVYSLNTDPDVEEGTIETRVVHLTQEEVDGLLVQPPTEGSTSTTSQEFIELSEDDWERMVGSTSTGTLTFPATTSTSVFGNTATTQDISEIPNDIEAWTSFTLQNPLGTPGKHASPDNFAVFDIDGSLIVFFYPDGKLKVGKNYTREQAIVALRQADGWQIDNCWEQFQGLIRR